MSKWILAAGAAALAIATPALAERGNGNNKGQGDGGKAAKVERGGNGNMQADVRGGGNKQNHAASSGGEMRFAQDNSRGKKGDDHVRANASRGNDHRVSRGGGNDRVKIKGHSDDRLRIVDRDGDNDFGKRLVRFESNERGFRRVANSCDGAPPGLVGKNEFCMPPGQYKKIGSRFPAAFASQALDGPYSQWYRDDDRFFYRNDGDYIYRVQRDGGLINALFPSLDRDYSYYPIGMSYPQDFNFYNVPNQYQSFYPDGGDYAYRYGDGAIYQVNPSNNAIQSIVQLLAGDLGVGQRMPLNYGAYNIPLSYRDRYYDTPQSMYRYNDGYIYQADPTTQLITAVISALV